MPRLVLVSVTLIIFILLTPHNSSFNRNLEDCHFQSLVEFLARLWIVMDALLNLFYCAQRQLAAFWKGVAEFLALV